MTAEEHESRAEFWEAVLLMVPVEQFVEEF